MARTAPAVSIGECRPSQLRAPRDAPRENRAGAAPGEAGSGPVAAACRAGRRRSVIADAASAVGPARETSAVRASQVGAVRSVGVGRCSCRRAPAGVLPPKALPRVVTVMRRSGLKPAPRTILAGGAPVCADGVTSSRQRRGVVAGASRRGRGNLDVLAPLRERNAFRSLTTAPGLQSGPGSPGFAGPAPRPEHRSSCPRRRLPRRRAPLRRHRPQPWPPSVTRPVPSG